MTEDGDGVRVSPSEQAVPHDGSQTRQRKKRKWDQPAGQLLATGVAVPGLPTAGNVGIIGSAPSPIIPPIPGLNPLVASIAAVTPVLHTLSMPQQSTSVPKVNQPKIHDELTIAREIVINEAEASIRHKLTKRQTQEEIQRCTGAVVITRGKYRPPNAPSDGEKPLYLHISAASHLKETPERILAVDRAAAMVEEMMKQNSNSQAGLPGSQTVKPFSTCVYLGFEADPVVNVAARIRGPNDQYINHIMNETGATVALRGRGSGNLESQHGEEAQQPLHLSLFSCNPKSLEDAKHLAENLLNTISVEFAASRVSSNKVYGAVPPPQQLLYGDQGSENLQKPNSGSTCGLMSSIPGIMPPSPVSTFPVPPATTLCPQSSALNAVHSQPNAVSFPQPLARGTSYSGYAGIYPQATPLQQVALALKHSVSPVMSTVPPTISTSMTLSKPNVSSNNEKERHPPQRRKFQELPVGCNGPAKIEQHSEFQNLDEQLGDPSVVETPAVPAPKRVAQLPTNGMRPPSPPKSMLPPPPPPPPKSMPPPPPRSVSPTSTRTTPPPPPKFTPSTPPSKSHETNITPKNKSDRVPDPLVKLMEYGDDEDEDEEEEPEVKSFTGNSSQALTRKPFWAV